MPRSLACEELAARQAPHAAVGELGAPDDREGAEVRPARHLPWDPAPP